MSLCRAFCLVVSFFADVSDLTQPQKTSSWETFHIPLALSTWSLLSSHISSRKEQFAFFWHLWQKASPWSKTCNRGKLWANSASEPAFPHWQLLSCEMVKHQRGVQEWLHGEQWGALYDTVWLKALAGHWLRCFYVVAGVRHKAQQITADYKPLGEQPEITAFDAVSSPLPPAAIHQHRDPAPRKSLPRTTEHCMQRCIS